MVATNDLRVREPGLNRGTGTRPAMPRGLGLVARLSARLGRLTAQASTDADDRVTVIGRGRAVQALDDRRSLKADWALGRWMRLS